MTTESAPFSLICAPIIEAVMDIGVEPPPGFEVAGCEARAEECFAASYPKKQKQFIQSAEFTRDAAGGSQLVTGNGLAGFLFRSADEKQIVQVKAGGFAFNRLAPCDSIFNYWCGLWFHTKAAGLKAEFQLTNFLESEPATPFDWMFEHTLYCAIQPARRDDYVRAVLRWLKPGGQFLAVHYMLRDQPDGPPHGCTQQELMERFLPHFSLKQGWVPRSLPNRAGLELMLWWQRRTV